MKKQTTKMKMRLIVGLMVGFALISATIHAQSLVTAYSTTITTANGWTTNTSTGTSSSVNYSQNGCIMGGGSAITINTTTVRGLFTGEIGLGGSGRWLDIPAIAFTNNSGGTSAGTLSVTWFNNGGGRALTYYIVNSQGLTITNSGTVQGTSISGTNGQNTTHTYTLPAITGTKVLKIAVSGNCGILAVDVSTYPACTAPSFSTQPTDNQSECIGGTLTLGTVAASQSPTYQWYSVSTKTNTGGTTVGSSNGGNSATYTPPSTTAGTYYYYCVATNGACTTTSNAVQITVNATTAISSQSTAAATYGQNFGSPTALTVTAAGTGLSYQWYDNGTTNSNSGGVSVGTTNGGQTASFTPSTATIGTNYYYCVVTGTCGSATSAVSGAIVITAPLSTPPTLTAATGASVDAPFDVTFSDETWRGNITGITVGGTALTVGYSTSEGKITFTPSASVPAGLLQTPGTKSIVVMATGYNNASVSQSISVGAPNKLVITTQPTAPASNGGNLTQQPVVVIQDQYSNATASTATVSITINGTNAINAGTTSQAAVSGTATFSGVKAGTSDFSSVSSTLSFASDGLTGVTSSSFTIPAYSTSSSDYFRSKATGNWSSASTWESSPNNSIWFDANIVPGSGAASVSILNNVTINSAVVTNNITVNSGKKLILTTGGTLAINSTKTLTVDGILENAVFASASPFSGAIIVNGTFDLTAAPTASTASDATYIPTATWNTGSTCKISGIVGVQDADYTVLNGVNQAFYNFEINTPNLLGKLGLQNVSVFGSANTFIVNNTGIGTSLSSTPVRTGLQTSNSGTGKTGTTVTNYIQNGGLVHIVSNSSNTTGRSFTVTGNFTLNSGTFNVAQYTTAGAATSLTVRGNLTVGSGAILQKDLNSSGSGDFGTVSLIFDGTSVLSNAGIIRDFDAITVNAGKTLDMGNSTFGASNPVTCNGIANLSGEYSTLTLSGTSVATISDNATISSLTVNSGAVLNVAAGKQLTLSSAFANNGTIHLKSGPSGTATVLLPSNVTGAGTAIADQYLAHTRNWYVSSPVTGAVAPTAVGPSGYTFYQRDEAGSSWLTRPFAQDSIFIRGKGYIALPNSVASELTFSGTLNTGNIPIYLTFAGTTSKGFNLVGNPYPSHLTWTNTFVDNNASLIEPSIYYRTTTGTLNNQTGWSFKTINASTGEVSPVGTSNTIPPMQAFWIRAKATGTLTLNNDLTKSHNGSNPLKAPAAKNSDRQRLRLQVDNGVTTDEAVIYFDAAASDAYDRYDSPKFAEANTATQIFTTVGTEKLVINGMNSMPLNQEIGLAFVPGSATSFSLRATELTNIPADVRVILKDNVSKAETDLTDGVSAYEFTPATTSANRFSLIFRTAGVSTAVDNPTKIAIQVFVNAANQLVINAPEKSNYSIYNAMGQQIENGIVNTKHETRNLKQACTW
jgi:hypothetical protein